MVNRKCTCCVSKGESCSTCNPEGFPLYWCESCQETVEDKRCPLCGLKAKRMRPVLKKR
jgi:predicted RNA-binding protein with PUA domain